MASEIENLAPFVQIFVGIESNRANDSGLYKRSYLVSPGAFRALARRAKYDPNMRSVFEQSDVQFFERVPLKTIDVLCSHPVFHSEDYSLDSLHDLDRREKVRRLREFLGTEFTRVLRQLFKMSIRVSAQRAAQLLHKYIVQRANNELSAYVVRLIYGLEVHRCLKLATGLFLMPYATASEIYSLPADPQQALPASKSSQPGWSAGQTDVKSVTALLQEKTWGISKELQTWEDDYEVLLSLASIAVGRPIEVRITFVFYPKWMENILRYRHGGGLGTVADSGSAHGEVQQLTGDSLARFVSMYSGFRNFTGDKNLISLIVGRMAQAYSRRGRYWFEDCVLDTSIALEMMYQIDNPESTYKLATRAAALIEEEANARVDTFQLVRKFYRLRSQIAHGKYRHPKSQQQAEDVERIRRGGLELAVRTLIRLVERGIPKDWNSLVVAGIRSRMSH